MTTPSLQTVPNWARLYSSYFHLAPDHPGKGRILRALHQYGMRQSRLFPWKMRNGTRIFISPREEAVPLGVGWTCFTRREWEPHLELCLRRQLRPGDCAYDIGANIGYFSAVMCQLVGPTGTVCAFEPAAKTYEKLDLMKAYNKFGQLNTFHFALGEESGTAEIRFDDRNHGVASLYDLALGEAKSVSSTIQIEILDQVAAKGLIRLPNLIKIDVEGAEMQVLRGAVQTIQTARPLIAIEYNPVTAGPAGWGIPDLKRFLAEIGGYKVYSIEQDGSLLPTNFDNIPLGERGFVDLCLLPDRRSV